MKFGSTLTNVVILAAAAFLAVGFTAEGEESLLTRQYDLGKERSLELQFYNMDVEIIARASDGSRANVERCSMRLTGRPGNLSAAGEEMVVLVVLPECSVGDAQM